LREHVLRTGQCKVYETCLSSQALSAVGDFSSFCCLAASCRHSRSIARSDFQSHITTCQQCCETSVPFPLMSER